MQHLWPLPLLCSSYLLSQERLGGSISCPSSVLGTLAAAAAGAPSEEFTSLRVAETQASAASSWASLHVLGSGGWSGSRLTGFLILRTPVVTRHRTWYNLEPNFILSDWRKNYEKKRQIGDLGGILLKSFCSWPSFGCLEGRGKGIPEFVLWTVHLFIFSFFHMLSQPAS